MDTSDLDPEAVYNVRIAFQTSTFNAQVIYLLMTQKIVSNETVAGMGKKSPPSQLFFLIRKLLRDKLDVTAVNTHGEGYSLLPADRAKLREYVEAFHMEAA